MGWIFFGLACLIIIILSIQLFRVSWQREDLRDENRILRSENQNLQDDNEYLKSEKQNSNEMNQELKEKIMIELESEEKKLKKESDIFDLEGWEEVNEM